MYFRHYTRTRSTVFRRCLRMAPTPVWSTGRRDKRGWSVSWSGCSRSFTWSPTARTRPDSRRSCLRASMATLSSCRSWLLTRLMWARAMARAWMRCCWRLLIRCRGLLSICWKMVSFHFVWSGFTTQHASNDRMSI